MSATTWCVVYNATQESQVVDDEGRTCYPQDFTFARRSKVSDLIHAERLVVVNTDDIGDESNPAARMAKEEVTKLNDAIDAEKAESEAKVQRTQKTTAAKESPRHTDASNQK